MYGTTRNCSLSFHFRIQTNNFILLFNDEVKMAPWSVNFVLPLLIFEKIVASIMDFLKYFQIHVFLKLLLEDFHIYSVQKNGNVGFLIKLGEKMIHFYKHESHSGKAKERLYVFKSHLQFYVLFLVATIHTCIIHFLNFHLNLLRSIWKPLKFCWSTRNNPNSFSSTVFSKFRTSKIILESKNGINFHVTNTNCTQPAFTCSKSIIEITE